MNVQTKTEFQLPVLDTLQSELASGTGHISCVAPVVHGNLQVGFRGKPDSMCAIEITEDDGSLVIDLGGIPVGGPTIDRTQTPSSVTRHTTPLLEEVRLERLPEGSWTVTDGSDELTSADRLVLSRTFAKIGERATKQLTT